MARVVRSGTLGLMPPDPRGVIVGTLFDGRTPPDRVAHPFVFDDDDDHKKYPIPPLAFNRDGIRLFSQKGTHCALTPLLRPTDANRISLRSPAHSSYRGQARRLTVLVKVIRGRFSAVVCGTYAIFAFNDATLTSHLRARCDPHAVQYSTLPNNIYSICHVMMKYVVPNCIYN